MTADTCAQVRQWLSATVNLPSTPSAAVSQHVAGCPHCRGALAALLAHLVGPPAGEVSCDDCLEDLPAYAELERARGPAVAAQNYPQLWWHLWTCPDCADAVANLARLLDAEAEGLIPAPPAVPAARQLVALPPIRMGRGLLHAVFGPQLILGTAWHEGGDPLFLGEQDLPGFHISIHVHQMDHELWDLEITVEPPVDGQVLVTFGAARYRAALVDGRVARVRGIPVALLADKDGPDMQLLIEREPGDGALP